MACFSRPVALSPNAVQLKFAVPVIKTRNKTGAPETAVSVFYLEMRFGGKAPQKKPSPGQPEAARHLPPLCAAIKAWS
jgi:hypothetical protein